MERTAQEKMTRWGVGPRFALFSIIYCTIIIALRLYYDAQFHMDFIPYWILVTVGIVLIVIGLFFFIAAAVTVRRAFNAEALCTRGVYGMCRHPVYAAWVVFLVPGLALVMNSYLGLTAPPVMYLILRILVSREEEYLDQRFGEEYRAYKERVPAVLPLGGLRRK